MAGEGFNYTPFFETFQEIPGREEEFTELKKLFQQTHREKRFPFSLHNNPIVDLGKNEKYFEMMEQNCDYELGAIPENPKDAGIDPEDSEFVKKQKELKFERERKRIEDMIKERGELKKKKRLKRKKRKKN